MKNLLRKIVLLILLITFFSNMQKCSAFGIINNLPKLQKIKKNSTKLLSVEFWDKNILNWGIQANCGDIVVVSDPINPLKNVMKAHININEDFSRVANGTPRAEILNTKTMLSNDSKYLMEFKTYLPSDFQIEQTENRHIFFQVHQKSSLGSPQLSLGIYRNNYRVTSSFSNTPPYKHQALVKDLDLINNDLGKWVQWSIYYRPSYSKNGEIMIWKNNKLILNFKGFCAYEDPLGYLKFGIYKWNWKIGETSTTDIATYFSDIIIYKVKDELK